MHENKLWEFYVQFWYVLQVSVDKKTKNSVIENNIVYLLRRLRTYYVSHILSVHRKIFS